MIRHLNKQLRRTLASSLSAWAQGWCFMHGVTKLQGIGENSFTHSLGSSSGTAMIIGNTEVVVMALVLGVFTCNIARHRDARSDILDRWPCKRLGPARARGALAAVSLALYTPAQANSRSGTGIPAPIDKHFWFKKIKSLFAGVGLPFISPEKTGFYFFKISLQSGRKILIFKTPKSRDARGRRGVLGVAMHATAGALGIRQ